MPNYYNPYSFYPATYPTVGQASFSPYAGSAFPPQASYAAPQQQNMRMMEWVEGEVGAKAFQMPAGLTANTPIPLWDSTDTVVYLKSWSPMGIPNPMQKLRYEMEGAPNQQLLSGNANPQQPDMSQYVTRQDLEQLRQEIRNAAGHGSGNNQNGNNNSGQNGNRGGNR